jgi:hypothetical protein
LDDAYNEALIYGLFKGTGANIAEAYPINIRFYNQETRRMEVRKGEVSVKFDGKLMYYRDLRRNCGFGRNNDEIVDFLDVFKEAKQGFINMLVVDYMTNQVDRHSKNFGILDAKFAPLYDNGDSLYCKIPDRSLRSMGNVKESNFKTLGRSNLETYIRYKEWLNCKTNIKFDRLVFNIKNELPNWSGIISNGRLRFIALLIQGRSMYVKGI